MVADEVRSLAGKTQQPTEEIQTIIGSLQKGILDAVSALKPGMKLPTLPIIILAWQ